MRKLDLGPDFIILIPAGSPIAGDRTASAEQLLERVAIAIQKYQSRSASYEDWLAARVLRARGGRVGSTALYEDYLAHCAQSEVGFPRLTMTGFGRALSASGFTRIKTHGGNIVRLGIKLRSATPATRRKAGRSRTASRTWLPGLEPCQ